MAKPFSIQSPENIAMEYGGNKQKIAQAMQLGVVDPTAGVLAGMFIDRMRSAQSQEQVPQATVAQQVMGGAQPAPPTAPSGGLGATPQAMPQAAPPMAPQMAAPAPQAPPGMAAGGMVPPYAAGGGLSDAPIPDGMFDEPSNGGFGDGYAGGGLVAFADGGDTDLARFRRAIIQQESGGRFGIPNAEGSGAMGLGQIMPDTARALAKRLGLPYRPDLLAGKSKEAQDYQIALTNAATEEAFNYGGGDINKAAAYYFAGPDKSKWGEKTRRYQSDIARRMGAEDFPERAGDTTAGRMMSREDIDEYVQKRFGRSEEDTAAEEKMRARLEEQASDEYYEKQRKADMWQTLAEIGFNMASSKSPYVLQALGEAAAAALPGARADKKERKALKDRAIEGLMELGARNRKEAVELFKISNDIYRDGVSQQQFDQRMEAENRRIEQQDTQLADQREYQMGMLGLREQELQSGKTDLRAIAANEYERLKALDAQGKYVSRAGKIVPYRVADSEIRARAYENAAKILKANQSGLGAAPGLTDGMTSATQGTGAGNDFSGMSLVGSRPAQ